MPTLTMKDNRTGVAKQLLGMPSGTVYTPNARGFIAAEIADVPTLLAIGCTPHTRMDNLAATTNLTVTDDSTDDYAVGSLWLNTAASGLWICQDATADAAVWVPVAGDLIGFKRGLDMNVTTDQAITMVNGASKFWISKLTVLNACVDLTTAAGGVYPAASKGGTAVVANSQAYTALSATNFAVDLTLVATPAKTVYAATQALYLSLTTAQGAAAMADVYVFGQRFTAG